MQSLFLLLRALHLLVLDLELLHSLASFDASSPSLGIAVRRSKGVSLYYSER